MGKKSILKTKKQRLLYLDIIICLFLLLSSQIIHCQVPLDSLLGNIDVQKWSDVVTKKTNRLEKKLVDKSEKILTKLEKQENKLYKKLLASKDSLYAKTQLTALREKYEKQRQKITSPVSSLTAQNLKIYIPWIDKTQTGLDFLSQNEYAEKAQLAMASLNNINGRLQQAEDIKEFIKERKLALRQQLERLGMMKELKKINKEVFYYSQQINEYKEILSDTRKIEEKAIELLSQTKIFKDVMKRNSMLSNLIPVSPTGFSNNSNSSGFTALQTRSQVNTIIQQSGLTASVNGGALQQNINSTQAQIGALRNRLQQMMGVNTGELEMPDFKYNSQRTKSLLKRIEFGTDFQTIRSNNYFPATSDFAFTAGYKLNDKSIIGLGLSYKLGWGTGWNNIKLTHQGVGLRSYVDLKLKGSFWLSGGYEMNYRNEILNLDQLKDISVWQRSGLIGMTKTISLKSKVFKKTKLQLLWDFLSYQQRPQTTPLLFRVGYSF